MKRFIISWSLLAVLLLGTSFATGVNDIELVSLNGGMVAKIKVADGQVRFQHQVEEPKDGKPYRVIVDVLSATHELGQQNFVVLPDCPIQQIRTSQYSVTPEEIVRIVFDMANAPLYQVTDEEAGYVKVIFTDRSIQPFTTWSSAAYVSQSKPATESPAAAKPMAQTPKEPSATKTAEALNQSAQSDKLASLGTSAGTASTVAPVKKATRKPAYLAKSEKDATPASTPTVRVSEPATVPAPPKPVVEKPVVATKPAAEKQTVTAAPKPDAPKAMPAKPPVIPKVNPEVVVASKEVEAKQPGSSTKPSSANTQQALAEKITASKTESSSTPEAKPAEEKKTVTVASTPTPKAVEKTTKPAAKSTAVAQAEPDQEKRTSRFRRSPTRNSKLQGTMVAEFPKRLVIKYKARNHRDPFATLIDDTRTYDNPIEQRVPNVEGLRLVGIIESQGGANQALFEDNTGYSYILKSGDKVKRGYVLRVEADRVYFQIFEYGWSRTVALEIEE